MVKKINMKKQVINLNKYKIRLSKKKNKNKLDEYQNSIENL